MSSGLLPIEQYLTLKLTDDKLKAYLHFTNPDEHFQCNLEQLEQFLRHHNIQYGIDNLALSEFANHPLAFANVPVLIASGDAPHPGENGYIQYMFDLDSESMKPVELDDGTVDYKQVFHLNNVRKGQLIARKFEAKDGIPGKAVTGEPLLASRGKEARFKIGKNVVTDREQLSLYAAIDGLITKTEKDKINVFPIYEINGDVDYNIGNIDFVGTVVIRGNVLTGFRIKASGDIRVIGGVEGAELEADGSIEITAGVMGNNKGLIKAGKNVKSSFIQEGNVEASEDIIVSQSIMHSHVRAGRNVICSGTKGLIVGGVVQAGEMVEARTFGNTMSTVTVVEVGVLPELRNELIQLRSQVRLLTENIEKSEKALTLLDHLASAGQLPPDKAEMRIKLNNTKRQTLDDQESLKERILEIERSLEDTEKAKVVVVSTVYSGTKIVIGRYTRFVKDPISRVTFLLQSGDISMMSHV